MGTSRPSLIGQCPPIKKEPDPIPYPHRQPPKTTNQSLRNQESCQFRTPTIEKRSQESPKGQSPDRPLIDQPNRTKKPIKSRRNRAKKSDQACNHWESPRYNNPGLEVSEWPNSKPLADAEPTFFKAAR